MEFEQPNLAPRLAVTILVAYFCGYAVFGLLQVIRFGATRGEFLLSVIYLTALLLLQLFHLKSSRYRPRRWPVYAALLAQACLVYLPLPQCGQAWAGMPSYLAGSVLLALPSAVAWPAFAVIVASAGVAQALITGSALDIAYTTLGALIYGLAIYGLTRLAELAADLHAARAELTESVAVEERVRLARDLHDLLGLSLSAIYLKCQQLRRLIEGRSASAEPRLRELAGLARRTLSDVRSIARSARDWQGLPAPESRAPGGPSVSRAAELLTRALLPAVLCAMCLASVVHVFYRIQDGVEIAVTIACLAAVLALQLGYLSRPSARLRSPLGYCMLGLLACMVLLPPLVSGREWVSLPGFLAGSALLVLRPFAGWTVFLAISAGVGIERVLLGETVLSVAFIAIATAINGFIVFGLTRLARMVTELREAGIELAKRAVLRERLRFARDVHDLLGFSLTAITLKLEVAEQRLCSEPERAAQEMAECAQLCQEALVEKQTVTGDDWGLSLEDVTRSVEALLASADVNVHMDIRCEDLTPVVRGVLATVLREGVTNVLRHSSARQCDIALRHSKDAVSFEIANDGLSDGDPRVNGGQGIGNLAERVARVNGVLSAGRTGNGRFRLRARIPTAPN